MPTVLFFHLNVCYCGIKGVFALKFHKIHKITIHKTLQKREDTTTITHEEYCKIRNDDGCCCLTPKETSSKSTNNNLKVTSFIKMKQNNDNDNFVKLKQTLL